MLLLPSKEICFAAWFGFHESWSKILDRPAQSVDFKIIGKAVK
jgi:hypothetical protein